MGLVQIISGTASHMLIKSGNLSFHTGSCHEVDRAVKFVCVKPDIPIFIFKFSVLKLSYNKIDFFGA